MKSRTRYALLTGCITFFVIATPLIIIFVSGYRYNFKTGDFAQTGALSAQSSPKGALLTINGKKIGKTAQVVRFLSADVYQVSLSLPGYFTWTKNLAVFPQEVTLAHLGYNAVTMFFSAPLEQQIITPQPVLGFFSGDSYVVYATSKTVYASSSGSPTKVSASASLPAEFSEAKSITVSASPSEDYFLLIADDPNGDKVQAIFVPGEKKVYTLNVSVDAGSLQFGDNAELFALQGQNLITINWQNQNTSANNVSIIAAPIIGYAWHNNYLYTITKTNTGEVLEQMNADGTNISVLYSGLPLWQKASLYLNQVNQIAILEDGILYSLSPKLQAVENYTNGASIEPGTNNIFYYTKNEIGIFDPSNGLLVPITRISQTITDSGISFSTGWAFYTSNNTLQIIEMDTRGGQNIYQLVHVSDDALFSVDPSAKYLYLLQNGSLERLQIR